MATGFAIAVQNRQHQDSLRGNRMVIVVNIGAHLRGVGARRREAKGNSDELPGHTGRRWQPLDVTGLAFQQPGGG